MAGSLPVTCPRYAKQPGCPRQRVAHLSFRRLSGFIRARQPWLAAPSSANCVPRNFGTTPLWTWRGSNPPNRPCSLGSVATVQHFRATPARGWPPWTTGCRGFGPASPRHQRANPPSSQAGALQTLLRAAVEALREDAQDAATPNRRTAFKASADSVARPSLIKRTLLPMTRGSPGASVCRSLYTRRLHGERHVLRRAVERLLRLADAAVSRDESPPALRAVRRDLILGLMEEASRRLPPVRLGGWHKTCASERGDCPSHR